MNFASLIFPIEKILVYFIVKGVPDSLNISSSQRRSYPVFGNEDDFDSKIVMFPIYHVKQNDLEKSSFKSPIKALKLIYHFTNLLMYGSIN